MDPVVACKTCQSAIPESANFCSRCGLQQSAVLKLAYQPKPVPKIFTSQDFIREFKAMCWGYLAMVLCSLAISVPLYFLVSQQLSVGWLTVTGVVLCISWLSGSIEELKKVGKPIERKRRRMFGRAYQ